MATLGEEVYERPCLTMAELVALKRSTLLRSAPAKKNGKPVEYIVFGDEGHGFRKKKNQIAAYGAILAFLDTITTEWAVASHQRSVDRSLTIAPSASGAERGVHEAANYRFLAA